MDNMLEQSGHRSPEVFRFDDRSEWYQVNSFLLELGRKEVDLGLNVKDVVHLGGTANFYRLYEAYGAKAVSHFRGTHDMDVVCFHQGLLKRVLDGLVADYEVENKQITKDRNIESYMPPYGVEQAAPRLHRVEDYSSRASLSLPDKNSVYVKLNYKDMPGTSSGFEIDVYESADGKIRFNNRIFSSQQLVFDPPEEIVLPTLNSKKTRGAIAVPSLRDYFIIKTDIVDFSNTGLRSKDKFDILTILAICEDSKIDFEKLLTGLIEGNSAASAKAKLVELESLFRNPFADLPNIVKDFPFLPSKKMVKQALIKVQEAKNVPG